jgi:hypothetical protein
VFLYFPVSVSTDLAAKELIEHRRAFWTFVGFSLMPKYQPAIETKEKMIVPVIDVSSSTMFKKVAHWLKTNVNEQC